MELSIICPVNFLGYGQTGVHIVDELIKLDHKINLFPVGRVECNIRYEKNIKKALSNSDTFDVNSDCLRIWHSHDMSMFVGKGRHVGFPIFELTTFTDKEKHHLFSCDELFVCSKWAKNIIDDKIYSAFGMTRDNNKPLAKIVPLGVDSEVFHPAMSQRKPTIFLNVGKWEYRKGHDILIDAFRSAFTNDENVELWMMCDNPFIKEEKTREWLDLYDDHRVRIIPRVESDRAANRSSQQTILPTLSF